MLQHEVMVVDEWHNNGPQDLITVSLCIQNAINKMHLCSLSITYAYPYHYPTATMGHLIHNVDISKLLTHTTPYTLSAICPVQWKSGFIHEEITSPKCQTPSNVSICPLKSVTMTNCSQVETQMRKTSMQMSFPEMVSDSLCRIIWLCKPIVTAAVWVAGLRWSWRWRCWMWRSWAGVVPHGLRLWGFIGVLPNSLKRFWRRLGRLQVIFLQSACQLHAPSKFANICGIVQCDKTAHFGVTFIVASLRHTCAIIMLSNQHLDTPCLWGGWIISAKEKCPLTQICEQYLREIGLLCHRKSLRSLSSAHEKWGQNKSVAL